jgi:hypothetical protein
MSGAAGSANCEDVAADSCGTCVKSHCCAASEACTQDSTCADCRDGFSSSGCDANVAYVALVACYKASCPVCAYGCNPVTNEGCDAAAGDVCDVANNSPTACFTGPNEQALCESCSNDIGPYCGAGLHCDGDAGECARMCCDSKDCGPGATCELGVSDTVPAVGVCRKSGSIDCSAPVTAPSKGSCFWPGG